MSQPSVSVIIVSRGRAEPIALCLMGVSRLLYDNYEIVVVGDAAALGAVERAGLKGAVKTVAFDTPNISAARNLGIAAAAGEIVAFIDDDAVPEPGWLAHLVRPFGDRAVASVGGFVRGRNGISYQWRARVVDGAAHHNSIEVDSDAPSVPVLTAGVALKTEGTNMAFRRDVLANSGGFDTDFTFFLDETDVNYRLAKGGYKAAISPLAEVHHAYAPSERRKANRAVVDLGVLGRSLAVYLRKHCPEANHEMRWNAFRAEQRSRLFDQMKRRLIRSGDVAPLLAGLDAGYALGQAMNLTPSRAISVSDSGFLRFSTHATGEVITIAGRFWNARRLRNLARERAMAGDTVSLYLFSRTTLYHQVRYHAPGYWEQKGGIWGRSDRKAAIVQPGSFANRVKREIKRVIRTRNLAP